MLQSHSQAALFAPFILLCDGSSFCVSSAIENDSTPAFLAFLRATEYRFQLEAGSHFKF